MATQTDIDNISAKITSLANMEGNSNRLLTLATQISARMDQLKNAANAAIKILNKIPQVTQAADNLQNIKAQLNTATGDQQREMDDIIGRIRDAFPSEQEVNTVIADLKTAAGNHAQATQQAQTEQPPAGMTEGEKAVLRGGYDWRSDKKKKTRRRTKRPTRSRRTTRSRSRGRSKGGKRK